MIPQLRDYQIDVVDRARNRMKVGGRRGIIQAETGAGKTVMAGYLAQCAHKKGSRVLILADRRRLVKQIGATLEAFEIPYGVVMSGDSRKTQAPVILASRDTFVSWLSNGRPMESFDLIMVDECHKSITKIYMGILTQYPKAHVIGWTATPARDDGKSLGDFFQWIECTVPASKLIADGWLIKPEVYAPIELARQRKLGSGKGLAGDPVAHWLQHAKDLPTIAFSANRDESIALRDRFLAAGIAAEHIDANVSDDTDEHGRSDRDDFYERLANGKTRILCSVALLVEGVDIPEVSCAILWSRFGSVVKFRQAAGRTMRPCPRIGKARSVILDHAGAAGVHGLPGEDVEWSLDLQSTVQERKKKAEDEGRLPKTVICVACGLAFSDSKACPGCGKMVMQPKKKLTDAQQYEATEDEILTRLNAEDARHQIREQRQRVWWRSIRIAVAKNGTAGMAASMFKSTCKVFPWEADVSPMPQDRDGWRAPAKEVFPNFVRREQKV